MYQMEELLPIAGKLAEKYTGIDSTSISYEKAEQAFLKVFPEDYVKGVLRQYYSRDMDMVDNICEILLLTVSGHILIKKGLTEKFSEADYQKLRYRLRDTDLAKVAGQLRVAVRKLAETYCEGSGEILEYLTKTFDNLAVRLKNASAYGEFYTFIF